MTPIDDYDIKKHVSDNDVSDSDDQISLFYLYAGQSARPSNSSLPSSPMARSVSTLRAEGSIDSRRRSVLLKQSNVVTKNGKRHHGYDKEKAPYPQSYDRLTLDLDIIDHLFLTNLKKSVTFVDFGRNRPTTCLDLGCGTGTWVLDALKEWPDCHFVGFDLVNIQPPLHLLNATDARRVKWIHGNFLTTKLPFEDDEFDHVHIRGIARAVPENKWDYLFEEITRVLKSGGTIEMIEEDIRFSTLPRWYTTALRARERKLSSVHIPDGHGSLRRSEPPSPPPTPPGELIHDHALLESLYTSVFETRFINLRPTSLLPSYFTTYFRQVSCSPIVNFPMPGLPSSPTYNIATSRRFPGPTPTSDELESRAHGKQDSFSSTSNTSTFSIDEDEQPMQQRTPPTSDDEGRTGSQSTTVPFPSPPTPVSPYFSSPSDDTTIGDEGELSLLPISSLVQISPFSLAMQLTRMYHSVLACQESMWEVLNDRIRNREDELKRLGWEEDEQPPHDRDVHIRQHFDRILQKYQGDMQTRAAIWQSLLSSQSPTWNLPRQGIMTKAEVMDEDRVSRAMAEAQKFASSDELRQPCRTMRIFIGINP